MKKLLKTLLATFMIFSTLNIVHAVSTELYEIDNTSTRLDKSSWSAIADSYQNASGDDDGPTQNLLDGNVNTTWHSAYSNSAQTPNDQAFPHNVIIKFSDNYDELTFSAFSYTTRKDSSTNGNIGNYKIYKSNSKEELAYDSTEWELIHEGNFTTAGTTKVNLAETHTATQIRIEALTAQNGGTFAGGSEFDLYSSGRKPIDSTNFVLNVSGSQETQTVTTFTGSKDGTAKTDSDSLKAILCDGSLINYWQSTSNNSMAADNSYLKIDLGATYQVDRVDLSKRYHAGERFNCTGNMENAIIQVSLNGDTWSTVFSGAIATNGDNINDGTINISFNPTIARYIRISSTQTYHWESENRNKIMCLSDFKVYGSEYSMNEDEVANIASQATFTVHNPDGTAGEYDTSGRPLSRLTDGNTNSDSYVDIHGNSSNPSRAYLQADLGDYYTITKIHMYRYTGNTYRNTVILVSDDSSFSTYTTVFNADSDNIFEKGAGTDVAEAEVAEGKEYTTNLPTRGRYVRIYANGTTGQSNDNHISELRIFGIKDTKYEIVYATKMSDNLTGYVRESKYVDDLGLDVVTSEMTVSNPFTKYVTNKVLSVRAQTKPGTTTDTIDAKFISSVPSVNLESVKFKIERSGSTNVQEKESSKVYSALNTNYGTDIVTPAEAFDNGVSKYFFVVKLNGIPKSFTGTITVTPCWLPIGETEYVEGVSKTFVVNGDTLAVQQ